MHSKPSFNTDFTPQTGEKVAIAPGVARVTAPNASAYTFTGTNSFLVGTEEIAIVDPGPDSDAHLDALMTAVADRPVKAIILTHTHKDHSALAPRLKTVTGAPLWFEGRHRLSRKKRWFELNPLVDACDWNLVPDRKLADGEEIEIGGTRLQVVATPGHCANHISLGITGSPWMLTGDIVMGWNSTLVASPDGSMHDYFSSLDRLAGLPWTQYLPAHGGPVMDGKAHTLALKTHREARNAQILSLLAEGVGTIGGLRAKMYPKLPLANLPAATMTLNAHLEYLCDTGKVAVRRGFGAKRYRLTRQSPQQGAV